MPGGSSIIFSFIPPDSCLGPEDRQLVVTAAGRASSGGEPFLTQLDPGLLNDRLIKFGFSKVIHLAAEEANRRYFSGRRDGLRAPGYEHLMWATV
jgi:hypothetical protein